MLPKHQYLGSFIWALDSRIRQYQNDLDWTSKMINQKFNELKRDVESGKITNEFFIKELKELKKFFDQNLVLRTHNLKQDEMLKVIKEHGI